MCFDEGPDEADDNSDISKIVIAEANENNSTVSSESKQKTKSPQNEPKKTVGEIFKERVQAWKKEQMKHMSLSDKLDFRDP